MIEVRDVCKAFGGVSVLDRVSFSLAEGEHLGISAPSGAGKTTLLRILCGLETVDSGRIFGADPKKIAVQFQEPRLFPQLTVLQNAVCLADTPNASVPRARALLERAGLAEATEKRPAELSGGMKQRVATVRALCADRPILLLDEPFSSLDADLRRVMRDLVAKETVGKSLILISHAVDDLEALTDRVLTLA